jgi:uncharacterized protein YjiS (DUF1127 family)
MHSILNPLPGRFPGDRVLAAWRLRAFPAPELSRLWWWRLGRASLATLVALATLLTTGRRWRERARQRDDLSSLDARMLRDIGVTKEQAGKEADKSFWEH